MNDLDPITAASLDDLATCLRQLHLRADMPTYRALEQQTARAGGFLPGTRLKRVRLTRSTLTDVLRGRKFPRKAFLLTFVDACGIDLENDRGWEQAWDRLAPQYLEQDAEAEADQLRRQLAEARAQADRADNEAEQLRMRLANDTRAETARALEARDRLAEAAAAPADELERVRAEAQADADAVASAAEAHRVEEGIVTQATEASPRMEVIDIGPHPRLLSVLGDIEFAPWQCLAELIDNSFDDFLVAFAAAGETPTVGITLPGRGSSPANAQVWIRDNGRGMDLARLNSALRAGWSGNQRYGRLGLFGMGFNIATARLGNVTTVRTTRAGDPEWIRVTIDLRKLAAANDFRVPVVREPKDDPALQGTEVIISGLKREQHDHLSRRQAKLRETLGDVYSYLLTERQFRLVVDNVAVEPRRPCVWREDRYVVRRGEKIPAIIPINERLPDKAACQDCGRWQDPTSTECEVCGSRHLEIRRRAITGWVGIQRYFSTNDFGIDFLRNGRKILIRDTRMFAWEDPDEPGARPVQEYPIELASTIGGRIVGEIHIDHVPVNYQKNAFEYDTPEWKRVVRALRGDSPLLPAIGRKLGYTANASPLARLLSGYRRADPGLNYLVPGDGKRALHERAREWAKLFREGSPEYQTDDVWYSSARQHDEPPVNVPPEAGGEAEGAGAGALDVRDRLGLNPSPDGEMGVGDVGEPVPPARNETEDERRQRYRANGELLRDLEGRYGLNGYGTPLEVNVWSVRGTRVFDATGEQVPVYVGRGRGAAVEVFIDAEHPLFVDFAMDPRDVVVMELAEHLRVRAGQTTPLSAVVSALKQECLPDHKITPAILASQARRLLDTVREQMLPVIAGNSEGFWNFIAVTDRPAAERNFAAEGGTGEWDDARASGQWIRHVPPSSLVRVVQGRPEAFLDGRVFLPRYVGYTDAHARALSLNRVTGYLGDVGLLAEYPARRTAEELMRGRLSCWLLEQELAGADDDGSADG
jgi:Histidine kinase-, DNA gyrase B-, and HSP90-like ATPase